MAYVKQLENGKWFAEIQLPERLPSGRPRRTNFTHSSKMVVDRWARNAEAIIDKGRRFDPSGGRRPFRLLAEGWAEGQIVEETTARTRTYRMRRLLAQWGDWRVIDIRRQEAQLWVKTMDEAAVGPHAIEAVVMLGATIMDAAVLDGVIDANPFRKLKLPVKPPTEDRVISEEEEPAIEAAIPAFYRPWYRTMLYTGMRWEEGAGIHIDPSVNMLHRRLHIRHVLLRSHEIKEYPKGKQNRYASILDQMAEDFDHLLSSTPGGRCPKHCRTDGVLLFGTPGGACLHYDNIRDRVWLPAMANARLCLLPPAECEQKHPKQRHGLSEPWPTIHTMRHTFGTRLADRNVPTHHIRDLMGHAKISATDKYLKSIDTQRFAAVEAAFGQAPRAKIQNHPVSLPRKIN